MIVGTSYAPECIEWFRKRAEARGQAPLLELPEEVALPLVTEESLRDHNTNWSTVLVRDYPHATCKADKPLCAAPDPESLTYTAFEDR